MILCIFSIVVPRFLSVFFHSLVEFEFYPFLTEYVTTAFPSGSRVAPLWPCGGNGHLKALQSHQGTRHCRWQGRDRDCGAPLSGAPNVGHREHIFIQSFPKNLSDKNAHRIQQEYLLYDGNHYISNYLSIWVLFNTPCFWIYEIMFSEIRAIFCFFRLYLVDFFPQGFEFPQNSHFPQFFYVPCMGVISRQRGAFSCPCRSLTSAKVPSNWPRGTKFCPSWREGLIGFFPSSRKRGNHKHSHEFQALF